MLGCLLFFIGEIGCFVFSEVLRVFGVLVGGRWGLVVGMCSFLRCCLFF